MGARILINIKYTLRDFPAADLDLHVKYTNSNMQDVASVHPCTCTLMREADRRGDGHKNIEKRPNRQTTKDMDEKE